MSKHTPGPWAIEEPSGGLAKPRLINAGPFRMRCDNITIDNLLVRVAEVNRHGEDGEANAHLIAAAPALAMAWELVPDEIKGRIFDALHKPETEWVEKSITEATGARS